MAKLGRPRKYTERFLRQQGKELLEWLKEDDNYFLLSFCTNKPYSYQRLSEWSKKSKHFSDTLKKAKVEAY